jgi:hypothetical protein
MADSPLRFKQFSESPDEALSMQQRMARSRAFKKNKAKIAIGRKRAAKKIASLDVLKKRARKAAREVLLKKITKDIPKAELSMSRRQNIEKQLDKKKAVIDKLARKMIPQVRKAELARKKKGSQSAD